MVHGVDSDVYQDPTTSKIYLLYITSYIRKVLQEKTNTNKNAIPVPTFTCEMTYFTEADKQPNKIFKKKNIL